ncbi:MAG: S26 family signal peptidase, partial [Microcoleus sp. T1-bin1]|nr:S26 family signal peptidase [Microcoleus sp. T1-bin1]
MTRLEKSADEKPPQDTENPWIEGIKTIGLAAFLAFGIRTLVAEARYIPTGSMLP